MPLASDSGSILARPAETVSSRNSTLRLAVRAGNVQRMASACPSYSYVTKV